MGKLASPAERHNCFCEAELWSSTASDKSSLPHCTGMVRLFSVLTFLLE